MAVPYNHREIEQKWRKIWEEHPVNVNDGKKPKYYCLDMFQEMVCMSDTGEDTLSPMSGADTKCSMDII